MIVSFSIHNLHARVSHLIRTPNKLFSFLFHAGRENLRRRIQDPRYQDQPAPNRPMIQLFVRQPRRDRIVGPVQQNDMHQRHAPKQRNHTCESQPILLEQLFRPYVPSADSEEYYHRRENRTPPTHQQRGFVVAERPRGRRGAVYRHGGGGDCHARLPPQRGTSEELRGFAEGFVPDRFIARRSSIAHSGLGYSMPGEDDCEECGGAWAVASRRETQDPGCLSRRTM